MGFSLNPFHDISSALDAGKRLAGEALHEGEKVVEDGAKGFASAMEDAAKGVSHMSPSELGHTALDIVGMVPVVGTAANLANAGWYAAQGDWTDAAWSAAAAIPIEGEAVDAAKLGKDAVDIVEDGVKAERAIKDGEEVASGTTKAVEDGAKGEEAAGSHAATGANQFNRTPEEFESLAADPAHGGKISPASIQERTVG
ncbi:MAG: hypothetical protein JOY90_03940, partial [Bradyrhizobium sp.]|uniref:hypothetical protein n=1 Tax=Bradyrhizobium sp. TaxID=376 RepID=UPI001E175B45